MKEFTITEEGLKELRKKSLIRTITILTLAASVGMFIVFNQHKDEDSTYMLLMIPIMGIALGYGINKGLKQLTTQLKSFRLSVTNNSITRETSNTPTITLYYSEIQRISKMPNGSFIIKGKNKQNTIGIPAGIIDYSDLEIILQGIMPVSNDDIPFSQKNGVLIGLAGLLLMATTYLTKNNLLMVICATATVALLSWSLYSLQTNKNIDDRTKRNSWFILLVIVSLIGFTILRLMGFEAK